MNIHKVYRPFLVHFRRSRMQRFVELFAIGEQTTVLDLGGDAFIWSLLERKPKVTLLNINPKLTAPDGIVLVHGDACNSSFADRSFDVVFSNSVIEHVGDAEQQRRFARECMRCGSGFYVQTPNKWFPVDPHTLLLFAHWLPKKIFNKLMWISPRFLMSRPSEEELTDLRNLRLLGKRDLQALFPGAEIIRERFCGITKSLIAVCKKPPLQ